MGVDGISEGCDLLSMTTPSSPFEGAYTALITPFRDGEVDHAALGQLVEAQIAGGIHGLCPCGTTGESATLSVDEHQAVFRTVVEAAAGRVPVVAGVGTNDTRKSIALAQIAKEMGADGLLIVVPYYSKPSQAGVEAHFRAILDAAPMPTILYDIPGRSGISLHLDTLARLCDRPEVVAIKDASGNVTRAQDQRVLLGDRVTILSGDDGLTVPMMSIGAKGVISVTSNAFPAAVAGVVNSARAGDWAAASAAHLHLLPTHQAMFVEPNPGPVKGLLAAAGRIAPEVRLPLSWPSEETLAQVQTVVDAAGLSL